MNKLSPYQVESIKDLYLREYKDQPRGNKRKPVTEIIDRLGLDITERHLWRIIKQFRQEQCLEARLSELDQVMDFALSRKEDLPASTYLYIQTRRAELEAKR